MKRQNICSGTFTYCGMFGSRYFLHLSPNIWQNMSWSQYLVLLRSCKLDSQFLMISSLHKVKVKNDISFKEKDGNVNFRNPEESNATLGNKFFAPKCQQEPHISNQSRKLDLNSEIRFQTGNVAYQTKTTSYFTINLKL